MYRSGKAWKNPVGGPWCCLLFQVINHFRGLCQINKKGQISNEDACFHLWSLAAAGSNQVELNTSLIRRLSPSLPRHLTIFAMGVQRDEMLDAFLTPTLIRILASPNYTQGAKYNAVGCLQMLCTEEEGCRQVWEAKVMSKVKSSLWPANVTMPSGRISQLLQPPATAPCIPPC